MIYRRTQGEIVFYDSRGVEINSVPVNSEGVVIEPGEKAGLKKFGTA